MGSDIGGDRKRVNKRWAFFLGILTLLLLVYVDIFQFYNYKSSLDVNHIEITDVFSEGRFKTISEFAEYKSNDGLIIITFVSYSYRLNAINWAIHMEKLRISNYAFFCLDREMFEFFKERRILCYRLYDDKPNGLDVGIQTGSNEDLSVEAIRAVWILRLEILSELLSSGLDVVFSDTDAVWLQNPLADSGEGVLSAHMGDIVSSRGKYPFQVSSFWGTTLCLGLVYFRSTEDVIKIVEKAKVKAKHYRDDQIALSLVLLEEVSASTKSLTVPANKSSYRKKEALSRKQVKVELDKEVSELVPKPVEFALMKEGGAGFMKVQKLDYIHDREIAVADIGNVRVALLPHQFVPRCCNEVSNRDFTKDVIVAHCHVNDCITAKTYKQNWGKAEKRQSTMLRYNSWCLTPSSQTSTVVADLEIEIDSFAGPTFKKWFQDQLYLCKQF